MSTEQWDQVGWLMIAVFFAACLTQPHFLTFCAVFGFVAWLLKTAFHDPTK